MNTPHSTPPATTAIIAGPTVQAVYDSLQTYTSAYLTYWFKSLSRDDGCEIVAALHERDRKQASGEITTGTLSPTLGNIMVSEDPATGEKGLFWDGDDIAILGGAVGLLKEGSSPELDGTQLLDALKDLYYFNSVEETAGGEKVTPSTSKQLSEIVLRKAASRSCLIWASTCQECGRCGQGTTELGR